MVSLFVIRRWFEWWCQYMEVRPVYLDKPNVRSLVIDLAPIIAGESDPQIAAAAIAQKSPSAFIISGHFPSSQYSYSRRNAFRSYRDDIKILVNRNLMQRNFPFKVYHICFSLLLYSKYFTLGSVVGYAYFFGASSVKRVDEFQFIGLGRSILRTSSLSIRRNSSPRV